MIKDVDFATTRLYVYRGPIPRLPTAEENTTWHLTVSYI